ncbi:Predicted membrane protein [Rhodococcus gordoniae]|uniref:Predicted membrane protein n=1 Tax=Rhodococcus gordoniae TaxID=223392 RepID=A0A379LYK9_9NOCA|nr:Predicted membrane protein [Rhodococcus gordoniae]
MKAVATGFLVVAAIIYLFCRWQETRGAGAWVGYVRAASEAGMVGALADWFAVTALFRHPLRIPVPHTAIIKRKKDQLGANLSSFVGSNFLAPEVVSAKVESAQIPLRVGSWLAEPANAARVAKETSTVLRGVVGILREDDIQQIIDHTIVKRIAEPEWGPPLGRVLTELLAENRHLPLVDMLAERAHQWALGSQETIDRVISRDSPSWSPKFVDLLLGEKIHRELVEFTWKIRSNPDHEVRLAVNKFLADYARDLQSDPVTIAKAEKVKAEIMGRDEITGLAAATWRTAKRMILDSVDDPNSTLRTKIAENVMAFGIRVREDAELRTKIDGWLLDAVRFVAANYADEITSVIRETVERWDAEEASRKIELAVGRDLQFIRINGTVVGSLAGLAIYTVSELLFA